MPERGGSALAHIVRALRRHRRRALISLANLFLGVAVLIGLQMIRPVGRGETTSPEVGVTFSPRQAEYLGMPWKDTFSAVLGLSPTVVRLGAYWDEIERQPGVYDFSTLDWQLERLPAASYRVVLTVGMKAPRWPEYYLPAWLVRETTVGPRGTISDDPAVREATLRFVEAVVRRYQDHPSIAYWQVENEPLDPAGPRQWRIGAGFLADEVALVRSLDHRERPVILSMFVDTPPPLAGLPPWRSRDEGRARVLLDLADVLGLDLYPSRGIRIFGRDLYLDWSGWAWERPAMTLRQLALDQDKDAWVMEAQAEPWEPARLVYLDGTESRSVGPATAAETFGRLSSGGFGTILLWGAEHWYMRQERHDDPSWLDTLRPLFHSNDQLAAVGRQPNGPDGPDGPASELGRGPSGLGRGPSELGRKPPD
jgi:hypothetical protein